MSTIMEDLKETTRPMHDSAEGSAFQGLLVRGQLTKDDYVKYVVQLYLIHSALEGEIQKHQKHSQPWSLVVSAEQFQQPFLRSDLQHFGLQPEAVHGVQSTGLLIDDIVSTSNDSPVGLLGFHYVLLGSKHGGKMVAKNIRDTYCLSETAGALYFDPYGPTFMEIWMRFKEEMNQLGLTDSDRQAVCQAAQTTFKRIGQIGDELLAN